MSTSPTSADSVSLSAAAETAGYAGMVPFIAALAGMGLFPDIEQREWAQHGAIAWGAVVLSFVGSVHWGLMLGSRMTWSIGRLAGSIAPSLAGAAAILIGGQRGLGLLVVGFGSFGFTSIADWLTSCLRIIYAYGVTSVSRRARCWL